MQEVIDAIHEMENDQAYGSLTVHFRKGQVSGLHKEIIIRVKSGNNVQPADIGGATVRNRTKTNYTQNRQLND